MKGVSSIVAVVLLIAISTIGSVGIFYWAGGMATKQPTPQTVVPITATLSGNGKILIANLGTRSINTTTFRTTDPHLWVTMCDSSEIAPHTQTACDLLGPVNFDESKLITIWGDNTGSVLVKVRPQDVDRGLIGWWSFDDVQCNGSVWIAPDDSGNGNNGVLYNGSNVCSCSPGDTSPPNGCPQVVSGINGNALEFDGDNDWIDCGNDESLDIDTEDFSIYVWATANGGVYDRGIVSKGSWGANGWFITQSYSPNYRYWFVLNNGTYSGHLVSTGLNEVWNWTNIVGKRQGTNVSVWINNTYYGSKIIDCGDISNPNQHLFVGKSAYNHYFNGTIDEVMYFSKALSENSIKWLYKYGLSHQ